jgi:hypothetical protein
MSNALLIGELWRYRMPARERLVEYGSGSSLLLQLRLVARPLDPKQPRFSGRIALNDAGREEVIAFAGVVAVKAPDVESQSDARSLASKGVVTIANNRSYRQLCARRFSFRSPR